MPDDTTTAPPAAASGIADPAPLGLAAFALTTLLLSANNAGWAPGEAWIAVAFFYGGLAQFLAGMWEFRNRNTFGATAFATYGAFWLSLAFLALFLLPKIPSDKATNILDNLGWFVLAFAIFNTYMMAWSSRVSMAVFAVFFTLEVTEIILFIGFFSHPSGTGFSLVNLGGIAGIVTAATAFYASAAGVANSLSRRPILPVGRPLWTS
jgi:uncharacterized protein